MTLSNEILRQRLAKQEWTSHNIRLTNELTTMTGRPDFLKTDRRLQAVTRVLTVLYRNKLTGLRIADLGCLEGGFSLALAMRGADVTGIEARRANLEKCFVLQEHFRLPNLRFVQLDVKGFTSEVLGTFDVVLALGILYHLDKPVEWLQQISEATHGLLVVDSHYAPEEDTSLGLLAPSLARLGKLQRIDVGGCEYEGRSYAEYENDAKFHIQRETSLWSSYSNRESFWLTKKSLLTALLRSGFDLVFEQHDYSVPSHYFFNTTYSRGMFLGVKKAGYA
jgi:SAM-dependent methyltransferase